MENDNQNLIYGAAGAAAGIGLSYYAGCYLRRTRGQRASDQFFWKTSASALAGVMLGIGGFFGLPYLPVVLQNPAAIAWMILVPVLLFGPFIPAAVYARRESQYRRNTRGPLAHRIRADLHEYFPRSLP